MVVQQRHPDKQAARDVIGSLLDCAGVRQHELAAALFLSRGALSRKLSPRYADRFTPSEIDRLVTYLQLSAEQHAFLLRCYGHGRGTGGGRRPPANRSAPTSLGHQSAPLMPALTSFVGRTWELATVKRLLATTRLVTLTGVGGIGKSRLALEAARELALLYRDGVRWFKLAAVTDGAGVLPAIAATLDVRNAPGRPLEDLLVEALASRDLMIILDNCEHLLDACAPLAERLLASCPTLTVLVTSREPLGCAGETVWRVPSLSLPPDPADAPDARVAEFESVRLFSDRAAAMQPDFVVTDGNAAQVAQICRRLDGIPLAIELVAPHVDHLSVGEIADRLTDALGLLTTGRRTAPPRHRTLRAALDWSYDLLTQPERALFSRLAVFMGGWTLEAAEQVCGDGCEPATGAGEQGAALEQVLPLLTRLAQTSLVQADTRQGDTRYRLLEPVRQYARERLDASGEARELHVRHADHYLALMDRAYDALRGPEQARWLACLDAEHGNLGAALAWSVEHGSIETGVRLLGKLERYWEMRGWFAEGLVWAERLAAASREAPRLHARALATAGSLARMTSDFSRAIEWSERSYALSLELGEDQQVSKALLTIGAAHWGRGDFAAARHAYGEALVVARRIGHRLQVAQTLANLGLLANRQSDAAAARPYLEESLTLFRALGDRWAEARVLLTLAVTADIDEKYDAAWMLAGESLALYRELGDERGEAWALDGLATAAANRGDEGLAADLYEECLQLARRLEDKRELTQALHGLATVLLRRGEVERARTLERECLALRREIDERWGFAQCLEAIADIALRDGRTHEAARLLGAAAALREAYSVPQAPSERPAYVRTLSATRAALVPAVFEAAWREGGALSADEAVAEALA